MCQLKLQRALPLSQVALCRPSIQIVPPSRQLLYYDYIVIAPNALSVNKKTRLAVNLQLKALHDRAPLNRPGLGQPREIITIISGVEPHSRHTR